MGTRKASKDKRKRTTRSLISNIFAIQRHNLLYAISDFVQPVTKVIRVAQLPAQMQLSKPFLHEGHRVRYRPECRVFVALVAELLSCFPGDLRESDQQLRQLLFKIWSLREDQASQSRCCRCIGRPQGCVTTTAFLRSQTNALVSGTVRNGQ